MTDSQEPGGERVLPPLGTLAVEKGFITQGQLEGALKEQDTARTEGRRVRPLGEILLGRAYINAAQLAELLDATKVAPPPLAAPTAPAAPPVAPAPKTRRAVKEQPVPFGKYTLVREIGRGGKGIVHEAIDTVLNRKVALKRIQAGPNEDPKELEIEGHRFLTEARISAALPRHPHIVGVYEAGDIDGKRYLSMELIEGQSLLGWRKSKTATFELQVRLLRDVALALDHAHRHGVIHRDIKPRNILVGPEGEPHLMDWGLARMSGQKEDLAVAMGGRVWGTPSHMSPEHARGLATVDHRTDIWALGVLLYEAIAGHPPFKADTPSQLSDKVVHQPVPAIDASGLSPLHRALEPVAMKALTKNPAGRHATAKAFADDLTAALDGGKSRKRKLWIGIAAAAVVAIAVTAVVLLRGPGTEPDLKRAEVLLAKGDLQPALTLFEKVLGEEPGNDRAQAGRDDAKKKIRERIDLEKKGAVDEARREEKERSKASEDELKKRMEAKRLADEEESLKLKVEQARLEAQKTEAEERARLADEARKKAEELANKPKPLPPVTPDPVVKTTPALPPPTPVPAVPAGPVAPTGEPKSLEDGTLHFEAEDFSGGEKPVAEVDYHDTTASKRPNAVYRPGEVDMAAIPGGFAVGNIAAGEWLHYKFTGGGRYQVEIRYAGMGRPTSVHLDIDGANATGPIVIPAATQQGWYSATAFTVTLPAGPHDLRVVFDTALGGLDWFRLKPFVPAPAPDAAKVAEAEKTLRATFKTQYALRSPADLSSFAKKLQVEGQKATDDPVAHFALLSEARDVAAQAGDLALAFSIVEEIDRTFAIDLLALKAETLATAAKSVKTPDAQKALAEAYLGVADEAAEREDYDTALTLAGKADTAARSGQSAFLVTRAQTRTKEITALRDEFRNLKAPMKTLADNPTDPAANLAVGLYRCFSRGEWSRGLPLLSRGSDPALAAAAQKESPAPTEAAAQAALGDAWREAGEKKTGTLKSKALSRALHWYEKALPGMPALGRLKVETQIEAITKSLGTGGGEALRKGLVFWVEPGKDPQDPYRELTFGGKVVNTGVTVVDSGARALAFAPGKGLPANWLEYPCSDGLKAIDKTGAIFAWLKSDNYDQQRGGIVDRGGVADAGDDFGLWVWRGQGAAWFNYPDNRKAVNSKGMLTPGKWTQLGISWDERSLVFYIDGKEDSVHPLTAVEVPQRRNQRISVGSNPPGGQDPYVGLIGSVMVYNRPIGAPEAAQLYLTMRARFR